jgi:hypothetical protein
MAGFAVNAIFILMARQFVEDILLNWIEGCCSLARFSAHSTPISSGPKRMKNLHILEIVFPQFVFCVLAMVVQFMYQTANYFFNDFEFIFLPDGERELSPDLLYDLSNMVKAGFT